MRNGIAGGSGSGINGWRIAGWSVAGLLWLLPLAAMQVTDEVQWTAADFVFAAVLIGGAVLVLELAFSRMRSAAYRGAIALLVLAGFLLIWVNAAVGIIGDPDNPLNLLYAALLVLALIGAAVTRLRARGMARCAAAAAVMAAPLGVVALLATRDQPAGTIALIAFHAVLVLLFAGAAWLFAKAANRHSGGDAA